MMKKLWLFVLVVIVVAGALVLFLRDSEEPVELTQIDSVERTDSVEQPVEQVPVFDGIDFQTVVDEWTASVGGESSVVILDPQNPGEPLASYQPDSVYFAASLYKLFVVYRGYQTLDDGTYLADEDYFYGQTRAECLDEAIRSSDSPCAETWWNELGKEELTTKMVELDLDNTSLTGISTTAADTANIMSLIWNGEGLSDEARERYLSSLREQEALYRRGLPSGFSDEVVVYNKVGWNLTQEWHDAAIVDFGDDRVLIVAVLTENVGMNNIAELATRLESAVNNQVE